MLRSYGAEASRQRSDEDTNRMAASFSLIIEDDAGKQIVVPFAKDVITIGRKEGNTIRLTERNVSRAHAKLSKEDGNVVVEDLTSFNGVKLNGDRIAGRVQVAPGDVIEIGDYHLELRSAQPLGAQKLGPAGAKSAAVADVADAAGDEFEGDTQRWDPPAGSPNIPVGAMPTQESAAGGHFGDNSGDTERLDLDKLPGFGGVVQPQQAWPPPQRSPAPLGGGDLEPTARQPVASVPIGGMAPPPPALAPIPPPSAPQAFMPSSPASAGPADLPLLELEPVDDSTQDMPLPAAQARAAASVQQMRQSEQTEQLRPAPAVNPADDVSLPRLVVLNTIFSGSTLPLRAAENVLGRTDDNDIVLEHRSVSRNHAKLVREGERVRILDLKSANGVLVNGEEVEQHVLRSGDVIELGRVRIRFVPVGERFTVPADEIERARIADAAGDDFEEISKTVNVTTPLRMRESQSPTAAASKPVALYAVVAVLVVVVVVLLVMVLGRSDAPAASDATPAATAPATVVAAAALPTPPPEPAPTPEPAPAPVPAAGPAGTEPAPTPPDEVLDLELADDGAAGSGRKKVAPKSTVDIAKLQADAKALLFKREYGQASKLLEQVVERNPKEARAHLDLGICYAQLRKSAKAKAHYQRFLELQPTGRDADSVRETLKNL
jgi:pSer/pThr/pTyr-binding forkhead associated (FHA) protein